MSINFKRRPKRKTTFGRQACTEWQNENGF